MTFFVLGGVPLDLRTTLCFQFRIVTAVRYLISRYDKPLVPRGGGPIPRPKSNNPRDQQLLVRVTTVERRVLVAAAALEQVTVNTFVRGLVVAALHHLEDDPLIKRQLALLEEHAARRGNPVVPIGQSKHMGPRR